MTSETDCWAGNKTKASLTTRPSFYDRPRLKHFSKNFLKVVSWFGHVTHVRMGFDFLTGPEINSIVNNRAEINDAAKLKKLIKIILRLRDLL